mgnify:CR=1 FL=1
MMTLPFTDQLSERWLIDRTYHAQLRNGCKRQEVSNGSQVQTVFPQFCYYLEVSCPSGIYRIDFFGPRMDEQGHKVKEVDPVYSYSRKESTTYAR